MIFNDFTRLFSRRNKRRESNHLYIRLVVAVMLSCIFSSDVMADPEPDKYYFRIAHSNASDKHDLNITSIGVLSLGNNMIGQVHLTHLASEKNGNALALELGAGVAFNWLVSPYLSLGIALGNNGDTGEKFASYFPEAGIVMDFTNTFGITISGKRYYKLYDEYEDVIMFGLVFRK
jgi:hypothetical protein